jgi:hypothetical protein
MSICEIRADPKKYIGRLVTVSGEYNTDSAHFEFVADPSCSNGGSLDFGFPAQDQDDSVDEFNRAKAAECERKRQVGFCVLSASVVVRGEIGEAVGADHQPDLKHLVINPQSVLLYRFQEGANHSLKRTNQSLRD